MNALVKKIKYGIPVTLKSGLHIGGSNLSMAIGGADSVVIRDPLTQEPIIPGSSIKGKMRSLTEKLLGAFDKNGMGVDYGPYQKLDDKFKRIVPELYGTAASDENNITSRIIVRDAKLSRESEEKLRIAEGTDILYSEIKTEVVIDRVTSQANLRQLERVPAGVTFNINIILNVFENDDEKKLLDYVKVGLRLMEDDYLGGKGSRGSGHVKLDWDNRVVKQKTLPDYEKGNDWQPHEYGA